MKLVMSVCQDHHRTLQSLTTTGDIFGTARISMRSRVYETVGRPSVRPSVCLYHLAGIFAHPALLRRIGISEPMETRVINTMTYFQCAVINDVTHVDLLALEMSCNTDFVENLVVGL